MTNKSFLSYADYVKYINSKRRKKRQQKKILKNLKKLYREYVLKRNKSLSGYFAAYYIPDLTKIFFDAQIYGTGFGCLSENGIEYCDAVTVKLV